MVLPLSLSSLPLDATNPLSEGIIQLPELLTQIWSDPDNFGRIRKKGLGGNSA